MGWGGSQNRRMGMNGAEDGGVKEKLKEVGGGDENGGMEME